MIDDVHEPLGQYASHFKTAHLHNTADFFEDLVRRSGVDEKANARTVQELRELEKQAAGVGSSNKWWRILRGVTIAAAVLGGCSLRGGEGAITGIPTGYGELDHVLCGLQPTDLIIVAARPSMNCPPTKSASAES